MKMEIVRNRIVKIRADLKAGKLDALIITSKANVRYATGFAGGDSWAIITPRQIYLLTDSRYAEQAKKQCACNIIERKISLQKLTAQILNRSASIKTVGIENTAAINIFNGCRKELNAKLKAAGNIVENIRQIKDKTEIQNIIKAGQIAIKALKLTLKKATPGISENELAGLLDFNIRKEGSTNSFETIVAFGPNASQPHYTPGNRKLKQNDTILIDFGATYNGYISDITRCFVIGNATQQYQKAYNTVLEAQQAAIEKLEPGVLVAEVEKAARAVIAKSNFPQYGHGTGHGIGLEVHELPMVSQKLNGKLQAGNVITIEPGIYIPGKIGIRIEDDILITQTGCKILTQTDKRPV